MNKDFLVEKIKDLVGKKFTSLTGIYYFGSRVSDKWSDGSDYDLALIFNQKTDWKFKDEVIRCIYDFMIENDIVLDIHIYSEHEFNEHNTPFKLSIKNEGIYYAV